MQTVFCDICRKKMDNPVTNRNFFYFEKHSVCEPCKENLELQIRPTLRTKDPFNWEWYTKLIVESIDKAIQKGKS
jgi:hypothetical protein